MDQLENQPEAKRRKGEKAKRRKGEKAKRRKGEKAKNRKIESIAGGMQKNEANWVR